MYHAIGDARVQITQQLAISGEELCHHVLISMEETQQ